MTIEFGPQFRTGGPIVEGRPIYPLRVARPPKHPSAPSDLNWIEVHGLIDTGANGAIAVSPELAARLGCETLRMADAGSGAGGAIGERPVVHLACEFRGEPQATYFGIQASAISLPEGFDLLIGLGVLTHGVLVVDGPRCSWSWAVGGRPYDGT